ncbi:MAG TPA: hypothetical protein VM290_10580 [Gaiellaceae bacterium]|nr:hypothetical protein [Gaiellaceae bacterium]
MNVESELFRRAVEASRLTKLVAPFTMTRLLVRAGVTPARLTREDLARALPVIEDGLRVYLDNGELAEALSDLRALAAGAA